MYSKFVIILILIIKFWKKKLGWFLKLCVFIEWGIKKVWERNKDIFWFGNFGYRIF